MEFSYTGVDKAGARKSGKLEAASEGELRMALRTMGIRPTSISKLVQKPRIIYSGGVPNQALVIFTRQLQVLISSGIPIVQSLDILVDQTENKNLRSIVVELKEKVSQGSYFWEVLGAYPRVFPKIFVALMRAGEASGSIDQMLKRLSRYIEDSERTKRLLKSAMMYPIIVICIGVGVVALMMTFVIPKFEDMLRNGGQELPAVTQMVIDGSHFLTNNALVIFGGLGAGGFMFVRFLQTPEGQALVDQAFFRAPLFGILMQKAGVARFSRTLQILLVSGVNLIDAIDICKQTIDNKVLEDAVSKVRGEVESGKPLGVVLGTLKAFPRMAVQMISVGESTGNLDKMLEKVADFYEAEVETLIGGLTKLIEPIVLVFLGGTVGGIMIAMYLPIFKMAGGAQ